MGIAAVSLARLVPAIQSYTPPLAVVAALATALGVGVAAGIAPSVRAARLAPIEALRSE